MKFLCLKLLLTLVLISAIYSSILFDKERDILISMKANIDKQLRLIDTINPTSNVDNMIKKETGESISLIQPEVKYQNKKIQLMEFYNAPQIGLKEGERIIGVHMMGYRYHYDQSSKFKKIPLAIIVTNKTFYVMKDRQVVAAAEILPGNVEVERVDFSQFSEEESNIAIYTNSSEISVLSVSMGVKINQDEVIYYITLVCEC
jgi:hypothetical protein